ncbi:MAG: hypothetical protein R3Y63_08645 [Eubacteriales bacterium]
MLSSIRRWSSSFNNKEFWKGLAIISLLGIKEAKELEHIKRQLQEEIGALKTQLVREGIAKKEALMDLEKSKEKLNFLQQEVEALIAEKEGLTTRFSQLEKDYTRCVEESGKLLKKLESIPEKKHNERGAGRKQSIPIFHIRHVMNLLNQGKSVRQISENLIPQKGASWTVEKIRYVKKRYLQQKEDGQWGLLKSEKMFFPSPLP